VELPVCFLWVATTLTCILPCALPPIIRSSSQSCCVTGTCEACCSGETTGLGWAKKKIEPMEIFFTLGVVNDTGLGAACALIHPSHLLGHPVRNSRDLFLSIYHIRGDPNRLYATPLCGFCVGNCVCWMRKKSGPP